LKPKNKTIFIAFISFFIASQSYSQNEIVSTAKNGDIIPDYYPSWAQCDFSSEDTTDSIAQTIIDYSKQFLGRPYRRGSKGPKAFDCSGFTSFIFKNFGYNLSPGCITQVNQGTKIIKEELKTGDLIFFKGRNARSSRVGHVGIVISNDENGNITFIHACRGGVKIEKLNNSVYYMPRYVTGLRVLEENA
jgi:cell wall-associated NlpC family hydrolase